jgi:hypothetical protein
VGDCECPYPQDDTNQPLGTQVTTNCEPSASSSGLDLDYSNPLP